MTFRDLLAGRPWGTTARAHLWGRLTEPPPHYLPRYCRFCSRDLLAVEAAKCPECGAPIRDVRRDA